MMENQLSAYRTKAIDKTAFFVVRHPIERFLSLYKNKCINGGQLDRGDTLRIKGWAIDKLLEWIESGYWNHHWGKQVEYEAGLSDHLIPLEWFDQWAYDAGIGILPHMHKTEQDIELSDDQYRRVAELYIDDIKLYERALRDYNE
jgi:hypothetical protein